MIQTVDGHVDIDELVGSYLFIHLFVLIKMNLLLFFSLNFEFSFCLTSSLILVLQGLTNVLEIFNGPPYRSDRTAQPAITPCLKRHP